MATLGLAGIGIPLWMAAAAGTIGLPGNDDWIYMRAASSLFRTGNIDMPGHTAASVGQLALVQPLLWLSGGDPCAFTALPAASSGRARRSSWSCSWRPSPGSRARRRAS